jgi:PAS domain S-box-containing protein
MQILSSQAAISLENARLYDESKSTADELRFLNDLVEQTDQPVAVSDFDGRLVRFNSAYEKLTGYSSEELRHMTYQQLTPEHWQEFEAEQTSKLLLEGNPVRYEKEYRRKDGTLVPLELVADIYRNAAGEPVYLYAFVTDITERKRAEQALRESEERYRVVAETASDAIITIGEESIILFVNSAAEKIFGYTTEEMLGQHLTMLMPESLRNVHQNSIKRYIDSGEKHIPWEAIELPGLHKNGNEIPLEVSFGESIKNGKHIFTGFIRDITERKRAEQALLEALSQVEQLKNRLQVENIYLQEEIKTEYNFEEIIGQSESLKKVLRKVEQVAPTDATVLIYGGTGTGKELIARAIHNLSPRKDRPLVKVNCGAISAGLVESELFGHEKGAFTGALQRRIGRFELADGGTIFLDEVTELPLDTQVKLLRVLQEEEFERVGSSKSINVDVRVIAATNRDIGEAVKAAKFRSDLFYRLNVFPLEVPPLRERKSDIPLLANFFLTKFSKKLGKQFQGISKDTMTRLTGYPWPGNIRELQNVIERAVLTSHSPVIQIDESILGLDADSETTPRETLEEVERAHILRVLEDTDWVIQGKGGAASILGINPNTLRSRMQKLGIRKPRT